MDPLLAARPFVAFGLSHGVVIIVLAMVAVALVALGQRYPPARSLRPRRARRAHERSRFSSRRDVIRR